uniref:Uncharacterized protein n=1 Tax=Mycena chlorophos TaxID=658473 RepID=A0ABQ0LLU8_MYCCL|nr:predicted protein [Mycena chlorophos]
MIPANNPHYDNPSIHPSTHPARRCLPVSVGPAPASSVAPANTSTHNTKLTKPKAQTQPIRQPPRPLLQRLLTVSLPSRRINNAGHLIRPTGHLDWVLKVKEELRDVRRRHARVEFRYRSSGL